MIQTIIYFIIIILFPQIEENSSFDAGSPTPVHLENIEFQSKNKHSREKLIIHIDSLNDKGRDLSRINRHLSLEYANEALALSIQLDYPKGIGHANRIIGMTNYHSNNYSIALEYINKAVDVFEHIDDLDGLADTKISIGHIYYNLNQKDLSLKNHREAYEHYLSGNRWDRISVSGYNFAQSLVLSDSLEKAMLVLDHIIPLSKSTNNYPLLTACYSLTAKISEIEGNENKAIQYHEQTLELSEELGNEIHKSVIVESLVGLAKIEKSKEDNSQALQYLQQARKVSQTHQVSTFLDEIYPLFIEIHLLNGNMDSALQYLKEYRELDKDFETKRKNDLAKTTFEIFHTRELEKEKSELVQLNEQRESRIKTISFLATLSIIVVALLLLYIVKLVAISKKEKKLNQIKSHVVSIISHELKTPIATISSSAEIIKHYIDTVQNSQFVEKTTNQIDKINRQVSRLSSIINDILVLEKSQNEKIKLHLEYFDLSEYISSIIEDYQEEESNKRPLIKRGFDKIFFVFSDKNLLYHIITNLLSNAYKYSPNGKSPEIELAKEGEKYMIRVIDYGVGITAEDQKHLFDVFFRADNVKHIKGTGIGLPVVKMFLSRLNGNLSVDSELGKGSTFTISIPSLNREEFNEPTLEKSLKAT